MVWRLDIEEILSGEIAGSSSGDSIGEALYKRDEDCFMFGQGLYYFDDSDTSSSYGSWTTILTIPVLLPHWFQDGDTLAFRCYATGESSDQVRLTTASYTGTAVDADQSTDTLIFPNVLLTLNTANTWLLVNIQGYDAASGGSDLTIHSRGLTWNLEYGVNHG